MLFLENCKNCDIKLLYSYRYFYICFNSLAEQLDNVYPDFPAFKQVIPKIFGIAQESYSELIKSNRPYIAA